jgi:hypothetical protein
MGLSETQSSLCAVIGVTANHFDRVYPWERMLRQPPSCIPETKPHMIQIDASLDQRPLFDTLVSDRM